MLIAFDTVRGVVITGPETCPDSTFRARGVDDPQHVLTDGGAEAQYLPPSRHTQQRSPQPNNPGNAFSEKRYKCVVCGEPVTRNSTQDQATNCLNDVFDWFEHTNGDADCFGEESMGDSHRVAVELSAYRLAHASQRLQSNPYSSDRASDPLVEPEKRVTTPSGCQWIETDVHLSAPRIAVEVFSSVSQLDLRRRLSVLFSAGYDAYLVFDSDGRYDPDEIEAWLHRVAAGPVQVGRFNGSRAGRGDPASLMLGTRLSANVLDPDALSRPDIPVFLQ